MSISISCGRLHVFIIVFNDNGSNSRMESEKKELAIRVQFLDEVVSFSLRVNALGKSMNLLFSPQLWFIDLV